MPLGQFANQTQAKCTPPLLDKSLFSDSGGYQLGRYCGLGSFEDGTTCCFPCPIQDWLYPPEWQQQLRVPNYLSLLSVILCCFLLLSFAVLPAEATHRHYLSVGLLFPVLFISLSFAIPVSTNPRMCHDDITPNDMKSSMSCAWTGALVTLGGLGCVVWVFLRSLWLHIRIFWDRDPGRKFKWGSIVFGTLVPLVFLIAMLAATGFSYRMGQTCLPNHENAIVTFWVWLVIFAVLAFVLQAVTTGYCFFIYMRTLRRERRVSAINSYQHRQARAKADTWSNVKRLFLLQWRNILVSIFVIIGSISFFIVFWTQDSKLGRVFNDPNNIQPVKTWIICQTLSAGDKEECRKYVKDFTVDQAAVLTSLILASLVGIEIFILLFRVSMLAAWASLFRRGTHVLHKGRPPTPQLTSLENPEKYQSPSPRNRVPLFASAFSAETLSNASSSTGERHSGVNSGTSAGHNATEMGVLAPPTYESMTSETGLLTPPGVQRFNSFPGDRSSATPLVSTSRAETPTLFNSSDAQSQHQPPLSISRDMSPQPPSRRLSQIQPEASPGAHPRSYTPMRAAPSPPLSPSRSSIAAKYTPSRFSTAPTVVNRDSTLSGLSIQKTPSSKVRGRISAPIPASFMHVGGAFVDSNDEGGVQNGSRRSGPLGMHPVEDLNLGGRRDSGGV